MQLDIFENLKDAINDTLQEKVQEKSIEAKEDISSQEIQLAKNLNAVEEYTLDRFEGNIAILENRETRKTVEIEKDKLPDNIKEGTILKKVNGKYYVEREKTIEKENEIKNRMNRLWK